MRSSSPAVTGRIHLEGTEVTRSVHEVTWDLDAIEKGGYEHFMLKEIFEQPSSLRDVMRGRLLEEEGDARLGGISQHQFQLGQIRRMVITACGTSWHAGLVGEYMLEEIARIPVATEYASEFRYRNPVLEEGHPGAGHQPVRGDGGYPGRPERGAAAGLHDHGDRERGRLDHRA